VFNNFLWKKLLCFNKNENTIIANRSFYTFLILCILTLCYNDQIPLGVLSHIQVSVASLMGGLGLIFMIRGLSKTDLQYYSIYNLLGTFLTFFLTWLLNDVITFWLLLSFVVIVFGYILFIWPMNRKIFLELNANFLWMILFFTLSTFLHWYNVKSISPIYVAFNQEFFVLLMSLTGIFVFQKKKLKVQGLFLREQLTIVLAACVITGALLTGYFALKDLPVLTNNLVTLIISPLTFLVGVLFLKEKFDYQKFFALMIIFGGTFMLVFTSTV